MIITLILEAKYIGDGFKVRKPTGGELPQPKGLRLPLSLGEAWPSLLEFCSAIPSG